MVKIWFVIVFVAPMLVVFLPNVASFVTNLYEIYVVNFQGIGTIGSVFYEFIFNSGITPLIALVSMFFGFKVILSIMGVSR